jgi:hypothetical protein
MSRRYSLFDSKAGSSGDNLNYHWKLINWRRIIRGSGGSANSMPAGNRANNSSMMNPACHYDEIR